MIGRTISHYKVLAKLGQGAMGEVWKAEDLDLKRTVALKFLSRETLGEEEVKARLIREAQAAALLDHPNICHVYSIHEDEGQTFIAMAYIDGPSLAEKIKERPLPLEEALDIAMQIDQGLQEAHEHGVVHRDIKPSNVLLDRRGRVKIMDFGLAAVADRTRLTKSGTTLGTPAYMSPEQAQGQAVDRRTDIWALGVVLYEMLTAKHPFPGEYEQAVVYGIINEDPEPVSAQRADVQPEVDRIVAKALAKSRKQRYQHADDLLVDLRTLAENLKSRRSRGLSGRKTPAQMESTASDVGAQHGTTAPAAETPSNELVPKRELHLALALAAGLAIALASLSYLYFTQTPVERPVKKWSFAPEALSSNFGPVAVSPNGRHIAYVADPDAPSLWLRDVDRLVPRELAGTAGARQPFWSPDSRFIGFAAGGQVKKISVREAPPITLCLSPGTFWGGSWSPDGEAIVFGAGGPPQIFEVPAPGGEPKLLFEPESTGKGSSNAHPHFLPPEAAARSVLMRVGDLVDSDIVLKNLETGDSLVLATGRRPVFSPSGHVVYQVRSGLWALPFSLDALKPTGEAFPLVENSRSPSVAKDGTLVSVDLRGGGLKQLVWRDRAGEKLGEIGQPQELIGHPVLSPDGRSVAVGVREGGSWDVWVHEVERPIRRRLTFDAAYEGRPQWSPSGHKITFQSARGGTYGIFRRAADGTGEAELLVGTEANENLYGWSRDGNYLLYTAQAEGNTDLWYLKRKGDGEDFESVPFPATPFNESAPSLSPDGHFLAYCSDLSGEDQVYVRPFPSGDGQEQVSTNGGCQPRWGRDGKELFYVEGDTLTAVEVATSPDFAVVSTAPLFSDPHLSAGRNSVSYDVSADGRFVLVDSADSAEAEPPSIHVVENWYEEFRDREQD